MRVQRFTGILLAALVVAAFAASTSGAAVWEIGTTKFTNGQSESVTTKAKTNFTLESKVAGTAVKLTATGVECVECSIDQIGTGESGQAHGSGKFKFTGVSISEPAGCTVPSTITTNTITRTTLIIKSTPTTYTTLHTHEESPFFTLSVSGCALAGSYPVKGTLAGMTNATGVLAAEQPVAFSAANQKAIGASLTIGKEAATLTGEALVRLSGVNVGKEYRGTES